MSSSYLIQRIVSTIEYVFVEIHFILKQQHFLLRLKFIKVCVLEKTTTNQRDIFVYNVFKRNLQTFAIVLLYNLNWATNIICFLFLSNYYQGFWKMHKCIDENNIPLLSIFISIESNLLYKFSPLGGKIYKLLFKTLSLWKNSQETDVPMYMWKKVHVIVSLCVHVGVWVHVFMCVR